MYTKKMLSAVTAVAIMSTGAIGFDMFVKNDDTNADIASIITDRAKVKGDKDLAKEYKASYVFDSNKNVSAIQDMNLSDNDKGDALIYPAFRSGDGWETTITVRNTRNVSVIAKAVLYDAYDTHELKDFNLYLSSHDVARFTIKGNKILTKDGSIMAGLDQTLQTNEHIFVDKYLAKYDSTDPQIDDDGNFILAEFDDENGSIDSGYVVIYVMAQTDGNESAKYTFDYDYYHNKHDVLYEAYYNALTECRGKNWKKIFSVYGTARNGTATKLQLNTPNLKAPTPPKTEEERDAINDENYCAYDKNVSKNLHFVAPDNDILFGEVEISKYDDADPRSLLLKARAIDNYTDDDIDADNKSGQMMLWAPGEYASIQDRRIIDDRNGDDLADYDVNGIVNDAKDFVKTKAYFTFNEQKSNNDQSTLIITQPMKRALGMAGHAEDYWQKVNIDNDEWGQFSLGMQFYDEDENADIGEIKLIAITSPANSKDEDLYKPEMAPIPYNVLAKGAKQNKFINNETNGYADVDINPTGYNKGLPAIITEMVSRDVNGEAQINWIYSATENNQPEE